MTKNFYIAGNRLLTHILFWVGYVLLNTFVYAAYDDQYQRQLHVELMGLSAALLVAYINMYVLLPRFLYVKKYISYFILVLVLLFLGSLINRFFYVQFLIPRYWPNEVSAPFFFWPRLLKGMIWTLNPMIFLTTGIKMFKQWYRGEQQQQEMLHARISAELNYLKAQVHPHFLFNTLNNLYSLTLLKADIAPKVVLKLSELLSFMLYDSQAESIALSKELEHIRNYIDLEKIRYGERLDVSFNVSGGITGKQIAPLLLIPFVENAFKHGVSHETDKVWVTIDVKLKDDWLAVKVENSRTDGIAAADQGNHKNGIGLQNVVRRLDLLYGNLHELTLEKETDRYIADLKLYLA